MWKTGKTKNKSGYILISVGKGRQVYQHRFVVENHLGRTLDRNEHVHHLNGDKTDNRIKNLKLLSHKEHNHLHATEQWSASGSLRNR